MALLTAEQAARRLGVKVETIYAYVSRGALSRQRRPGVRQSWFDADEVDGLARRGRPRRTTRPPAIDLQVETSITAIGDHQVRYRGHDAATLATRVTFEQAAELLWTGSLPPTFEPWTATTLSCAAVGGRIDTLRQAVVLTAAGDELAGDLRPDAVVPRARGLLATMVGSLPFDGDDRVPRLVLGEGAPLRSTIAGRLWPRLTRARPRPALVRAVNAALVLFADHELAPSTLAARVAASTRADPYAVVLAGLGVLAGPLHGRASRDARRLLEAAAVDGPARAVADALGTFGGYPGFGHPLYPDGDPRARVLLDLVRAAAGADALTVVDGVLRTVRRRAAVEPNVDLALAALTSVAGMRADAGEIVFAVARCAGWLAHALEEYAAPPLRFRARAVFVHP